MASTPARLTIVPYLKSWDASRSRLAINVLVVPVGDPRQPLSQGWPSVPASVPFEGATIELVPHIGSDPTLAPTIADVPASATRISLPSPANQAAIFAELAARYTLTAPQAAATRTGSATLRKYLPTSYRTAFGFTSPWTDLAVIDDSYHCVRRCPPATVPSEIPWSEEISWGDIFAMLLRQPAVARASGLIHTVELDVGTAFAGGGWLFFTLGASGDFRAQAIADPAFARVFGTRIPPLVGERAVFTPVLFPIAADAAAAAAFGPLDEVFPEVAAFDDGFAKIVHASQARTADHAEDGASDFALPLRDEGVRLGWDDEWMVVRLDRGLSATKTDGTPLPDAPTGTAGYRVDVRGAGSASWSSLTGIDAPGLAIGAARLPAFGTELMVEVHPSQLGDQFWVPPHYTRWRGGSLVADTMDERLVAGDEGLTPNLYEPVDYDRVPLRYGRDYEFRVRMVDATGGGPALPDAPIIPADAPVARLRFKRFVPLGTVKKQATTGSPPSAFRVNRPQIAHPQAAFAAAPNAIARLAAQARANAAAGVVKPLTVPDPDADFLEIRVMVLYPRFDPIADAAGFVELYRTTRAFPALDAAGEEAAALSLEIAWTDCMKLSDITWEDPAAPLGSLSGPISAPSARRVRFEVRALARDDSSYFGDPRARYGEVSFLTSDPVIAPASVEAPLFQPRAPEQALASVFLRPDPDTENASQAAIVQPRPSAVLPARLAAAVNLVEDESVLMADAGRRTVFGCRGLNHLVAPDYSSVQLTAIGELTGTWINVLQLEINRDWSWLGYADNAFHVTRTITLVGRSEARPSMDLGVLSPQHTVSVQAGRGTPDRESFNLCFIDAFMAPLGADRLPYEVEVRYDVRAKLRFGPDQTFSVTNRLPVTTPPRQLPTIVSTGHALGDYRILGDYEETGVRERGLWIEFAEPPEDPRNNYFVRLLHSTPDPMLLPGSEPMADPPAYSKRPLDAELVRVVRPNQVKDFAGLSIMQRLVPCETLPGDRPRHYLLPPPPTLAASSPELFGFFTYEFVVGHDRGPASDPFWVTAQGRFGPPLILEGVQHPAPPLPVSVDRDKSGRRWRLSSEFARAVKDGRVLSPRTPTTEIWVVAYARVMQADAASWRNIQIDQRRATPGKGIRYEKGKYHVPSSTLAETLWHDHELLALLTEWGLPEKTALGFVAVELLPEPNGRFRSPLSADLGQVRILRTSRLISAGDTCCV